MNDKFFEGCHHILVYERKEGTKESFYQVSGSSIILPRRISWGIHAQRKDSRKDIIKKNEINGSYRKSEQGFYSGFPNRRIHTSVWKYENFPEFYGYGILDERYSIRDLLIIYSSNNCRDSFEIHILQGLGKLEFLDKAFQYLRNYKNKKP